jgi:hypothetical protein
MQTQIEMIETPADVHNPLPPPPAFEDLLEEDKGLGAIENDDDATRVENLLGKATARLKLIVAAKKPIWGPAKAWCDQISKHFKPAETAVGNIIAKRKPQLGSWQLKQEAATKEREEAASEEFGATVVFMKPPTSGVGVAKGAWEAEVDLMEFCGGVKDGSTPVDKIPESVIDALKKWAVGMAKLTGRDPAIPGIICVEKPTFVNRTAA